MLRIIVLSFLLLPISINAQLTSEGGWAFSMEGFRFSIDGAYGPTDVEFSDDNANLLGGFIGESFEGDFAYSGSMRVGYYVLPKLFVETGAQYLSTGYQRYQDDLLFGIEIDPLLLFFIPELGELPESSKTIYRTEFIQVPLIVGYELQIIDRLSFNIAGGIESSFLISSTEELTTTYISRPKTTEKSTDVLSKESVSFAGTFEPMFQFRFTEKSFVMLGGKGSYFFTPINTDDVTQKPYWGGVRFGLGVKL